LPALFGAAKSCALVKFFMICPRWSPSRQPTTNQIVLLIRAISWHLCEHVEEIRGPAAGGKLSALRTIFIVIQDLLGHRHIKTTAGYARVAVALIRQVQSPLEHLNLARLRWRHVGGAPSGAVAAEDIRHFELWTQHCRVLVRRCRANVDALFKQVG